MTMTANYDRSDGTYPRSDAASPCAGSDSAGGLLSNRSNKFERLLSKLMDGTRYRYELTKYSVAISILIAIVGSSCSMNSDDAYTEYFPKADGDKPAEFKFGYKNSCATASAEDLETYLSSVEAFAISRHMLRISPKKKNSEILASYARGAPMRVHILVKRTANGEAVMGISTLRGLECDDCAVARKTQFSCPSQSET